MKRRAAGRRRRNQINGGKTMERLVGTVSRGIRAPIIREGDDIAQIVVDSVLAASESAGFQLDDHDVVGVTEAVVARAQGNYATVSQIAADVRSKFGDHTIGVVFPILSRNRFAICLKGIATGARKIVLMLSYPSDEVGNHLVDLDLVDEKGVDPYRDVLSEAKYRELFGYHKHVFTGVDYIEYYKEVITGCGCEVEVVLANDCRTILNYTKHVLCCDIHTRERSKRLLKKAGAELVLGLDDLMTAPARDCQSVVERIQKSLKERTGKHIEVMIYGDGAFKDPVGKIWELADPVVSPAYTAGLEGQPNEVKLKYLADNDFADLSGDALKAAISDYIRHKDDDLKGKMVSQGTTPRRLTDLIGSLCDLTSGSGDKGTPIILVQGYFDNYTK